MKVRRLKAHHLIFFAISIIGAVAVNCAGSAFAGEITVPLYLDSLLTMSVTATAGLWGGIICAIASNVTLFFFDYTMLPFTTCHVLTALLSHVTFSFCKKSAGLKQNAPLPISAFLWAGLWSALSNTILGNMISQWLFSSITLPKMDYMVQGVYIATGSLFFATYLTGALTNITDKMISAVLSYGYYRLSLLFLRLLG